MGVALSRPLAETPLTCHSEEPQATRNLALPLRQTRARFLAAFTLSTQGEILRFAQDDSARFAQNDSACMFLPFANFFTAFYSGGYDC